MSFRTDCQPFFNKDLLFEHDAGHEIDGNAVLYTSVYFLILKELSDLQLVDATQLKEVYAHCSVERGLIDRGKDNLSLETQDDYYGLLGAAQVVVPTIAFDIYYYGKRNWWVFDNMHLTGLSNWFKCCLGRFPGFVGHAKFCAYEPLNIWDKFYWSLGMVLGGLGSKKNTSGRQLEWCMLKAYNNQLQRHFMCSLAATFWMWRLRANYPNLMGDVFESFYYKDHPFSKWMMGHV